MSRPRPEDPRAVRVEVANAWAWCGARRLTLTPRAFAVLRHLVEHRGRLITKEELFTTVWRDAIVSDAAIVTGAGQGIGRAIVVELAKAGAHVVASGCR